MSNSARVQIHHGDISEVRSPWKVAAQHKHWNKQTCFRAEGLLAPCHPAVEGSRTEDLLDVPTVPQADPAAGCRPQSTNKPPCCLLPP